MGAADGAGIGLGVEAAIARVIKLTLADRAHGKGTHGGLVTIIGNILNDSKARAAVRTVHEGIQIPPIGRIKQFSQAIVAGGGIGRNQGATFRSCFTVENNKARFSAQRNTLCRESNNARERRRLFTQRPLKISQRLAWAFDLDHDTRAIILDITGELPAHSLSIDKRTKTYALDNPLDDDTLPLIGCLAQSCHAWLLWLSLACPFCSSSERTSIALT